MENRIKEIMADIFNVNSEAINDESSPKTIESWDSLKHMHLVLALEQEFGVEINGELISSMLSYRSIVKAIGELIK